jgi:hypothetical protein
MYSRRQYLEGLIPRYLKEDRKDKSRLLDEYCFNTRQNRKYVIRKTNHLAFNDANPRKKRAVRSGRKVEKALWEL